MWWKDGRDVGFSRRPLAKKTAKEATKTQENKVIQV